MKLYERQKIPKIPTINKPTVSAVKLMAAIEIIQDTIKLDIKPDKSEIDNAYKWLYCDIELKLYKSGYENLHKYLKS